MIGIVKLTSAPTPKRLPDRTVYVAPCDMVPSGRGLQAIMLPPVPGFALPYAAGDTLLAGIDGGTAYVLGAFVSTPEHDGHTMLAARSAEKQLRLGPPENAEWQALMLYDEAHAELNALRSALKDVVLPALAALLASPFHVQNTAQAAEATARIAALSLFHGGEATDGVVGTPVQFGHGL